MKQISLSHSCHLGVLGCGSHPLLIRLDNGGRRCPLWDVSRRTVLERKLKWLASRFLITISDLLEHQNCITLIHKTQSRYSLTATSISYLLLHNEVVGAKQLARDISASRNTIIPTSLFCPYLDAVSYIHLTLPTIYSV